MAYKITDTGQSLQIMVKHSLIELSYGAARMLTNQIKSALDARKEKKQ